eukprot:CAMPEP_0174758638 /NCGR_PEP_ID=MMETSP1094-20130205/107867_1 /TAXON_ID=156173 /ORGANISM="Chrysochromulina brevifilum, Strain UTEX LB 985" /LENGTH=187 /DNA_ID=CAMNT_0015964565 /DNA_START=570 /DNA_END=1132 /DNA_ORIENTATION=-
MRRDALASPCSFLPILALPSLLQCITQKGTLPKLHAVQRETERGTGQKPVQPSGLMGYSSVVDQSINQSIKYRPKARAAVGPHGIAHPSLHQRQETLGGCALEKRASSRAPRSHTSAPRLIGQFREEQSSLCILEMALGKHRRLGSSLGELSQLSTVRPCLRHRPLLGLEPVRRGGPHLKLSAEGSE